MGELENRILTELADLEAIAMKLRVAASGAKAQTDLEVAILTRQLADRRERDRRAAELIDKSVAVLKEMR